LLTRHRRTPRELPHSAPDRPPIRATRRAPPRRGHTWGAGRRSRSRDETHTGTGTGTGTAVTATPLHLQRPRDSRGQSLHVQTPLSTLQTLTELRAERTTITDQRTPIPRVGASRKPLRLRRPPVSRCVLPASPHTPCTTSGNSRFHPHLGTLGCSGSHQFARGSRRSSGRPCYESSRRPLPRDETAVVVHLITR
jgi:hypothetical protein